VQEKINVYLQLRGKKRTTGPPILTAFASTTGGEKNREEDTTGVLQPGRGRRKHVPFGQRFLQFVAKEKARHQKTNGVLTPTLSGGKRKGEEPIFSDGITKTKGHKLGKEKTRF